MILPDVQAVLCLHAFHGHAGAHDLAQAIDVDGVHIKGLFNLLPHGVGPGFRAKNTHFQRCIARVEALGGKLIQDRQRIGRCDGDALGLKILDQAYLARGHATGNRIGRQPQRIGAQMDAQTAGKKAIAIGVVQHISGLQPRRAQGPRHNRAPDVQIVLRVPHNRRRPRGAGRGMQPRQFVARHGEHLERIIVTQVGFDGEGELGQVFEAVQIVRMDACGIEALLVEGHVVIGMAQRPFQPFNLKRADLVPAGDFNGVERAAVWCEVFHGAVPSSSKWVPLTVRDRPRNSAMLRPSSPVTVTS